MGREPKEYFPPPYLWKSGKAFTGMKELQQSFLASWSEAAT
jgi:hypothetical protein